MENIINLLKSHKKIAILIPIILLLSIAIIVLFTNITFNHFKNLAEANTPVSANAVSLAGNIAISSDDLLFVVISGSNEKSEEEKKEDEEKDKEEEEKAKEEELAKEKNAQKEEKKTNENTQNQNTTPTNSYYIKINRQANTVTVYTKDANGNYTIPVKAMVCSTGYASPTGGVYSMYKIGTWHTLMGGVYGQYCTQITGDFLFHSVPYLRRGDNASLEYWAYDRLGTTASAGCVRLTTADAQWIYYNCSNGTKVEFYSSSDPGPLGKPTATKISDTGTPYMNWDPTDPNPNNPWKNKQVQTQTQEQQTQTQAQTQQPTNENTSNSNNSSVTVTSIENKEVKNNTTNANNNSTIIKNNTLTNTNTNTNNTTTNSNVNNSSNNITNISNTTTTNSTTNKTNNTQNSINNTTNNKSNTTINTSNNANNSNNKTNSNTTSNQTNNSKKNSESNKK